MSSFSQISDSMPLGFRAPLAALLCGFAMMAATSAMAGDCGDDVNGQRVPCSCGDNVVSDTVLWPTDPVVAEPCSYDGLVMLAPSSSDGITLNLGGQSIVGTGHGAGIRVVRGGRVGSIIVGGDEDDARAEIARFDTGIRASGRNVLLEVRGLDVHANRDDGLKIRTSGVRIVDVRVEGNGRHGLAISGHGNEVVGVVSERNRGDGLQVRGTGAEVEAESIGNNGNGVSVGGRGNHVSALKSEANAGVAVKATGSGHEVAGLKASNNAKGEFGGREGAAR